MTTTDLYRKRIEYDRETRDFALYLDDELVGYARSYADGESTLDALVFELLTHDARLEPVAHPLVWAESGFIA